MRAVYEKQLEQLKVELIEMGALCEQVIAKTFKVLTRENMSAAKEIYQREAEIDQKEQEIESLCLKLILRQQPVAGDLREVSAALKMITDMERIGDQASDIAEILEVADLSPRKDWGPLGEMAEVTMKMVTESVDAYVKNDLELAEKAIKDDDVVDDLFLQVRDKLIHMISEDRSTGEYAMDILMIAKYYERIGDHATNIAEWVAFSITGHHVSQNAG